MIEIQSIGDLLRDLWRHISQRRKMQAGIMLTLMLATSFAEVASISAVLPFLAVLAAPDRVFNHPSAQWAIELLHLTSPDSLLVPLTVVFCLAALLAGGMRLLLLWSSTRLSFAIGADLSVEIYRRTLYQPYSVHVDRNSSEVINGISSKVNGVTYSTLMSSLTIISSTFMLLAILIVLLLIDPVIATCTMLGFGALYGLIIKANRKQLLGNSKRVARESSLVIKSLQEGLGGIRDVLVDGTQETFCRIYQEADLPLRRAQGENAFISNSPRYAVESLGMVFIASLACVLTSQVGELGDVIPTLGALALGAQRLLPVLQQSYAAWSSLRGGQASLQDTILLLRQPLPDYAVLPDQDPLTFRSDITLERIWFRYSSETDWILKDLNFTIHKGESIGIIGATGVGKSTFIDILMGLLEVERGVFKIDGQVVSRSNWRAWQKHITHVPQSIYLSDSTIEENIAFGVPTADIDHDRIRMAANKAQIKELIESWPSGYKTVVGERGVRLSGGQRQRIGIARALYKRADVIILDEATSALDDDTERAVMKSVSDLGADFTVFIIAHRLSTLANCSKIIELENRGIKRVASYREITNKVND